MHVDAQRVQIALFYAHPDDESFSVALTAHAYRRQGVRVGLVCTTLGEAGKVWSPEVLTAPTLGETRRAELLAACEVVGLDPVELLGYRDSGRLGAADNAHPRAYMNQPAAEVVPRLVEILRRWRPDAVVTFDERGGYGHPDHIAIHNHTKAALEAAAEGSYRPDLGPPWRVAGLFYSVFRRSALVRLYEELVARGADASRFASAAEGGRGWPDEVLNVVLDLQEDFDVKWRALMCHRTQIGPHHPFRQVPYEVAREVLGVETYVRAVPETPPGRLLPGLLP